ncbi:MAG TPA: hypothetical protein DCM86_20315 [Verrucomicrobiales bacterium]|mgnify:CR=1 FL=1|nr:hypothetical protein [Verrucomicrobiales bacterium]
MGGKRIKTIAGCVLIAASGLWLFFSSRPTPPFDSRVHQAIGQALGEEAMRLAAGKGQVVLIQRDTSVIRSPATEAQVASLFRALKAGGSGIRATNSMKVDPLRVPTVPAGDFYQIVKKATEGDVVVSLLGPPGTGGPPPGKFEPGAVKVIALCSQAVVRSLDLRDLFTRGLLTAAVVDRSSPPGKSGEGLQGRALFDQYYQVITAANLGELPGGPGKGGR